MSSYTTQINADRFDKYSHVKRRFFEISRLGGPTLKFSINS